MATLDFLVTMLQYLTDISAWDAWFDGSIPTEWKGLILQAPVLLVAHREISKKI